MKDDYKSALAAHERGMKYLNGYTYEIVDWMDVATVHFALGNKAEAQYAFDKGVEEVNVPSQKDHLLYSIYKRDKEYEKALASLEKVYEYACKAFTKSINQNFQTVHKNYYNDKLARETREKRNLSIMSLVVICALIILIVAGTLIFRLTIKAKKKSLELQAFHIRELLAELENKARDITHLTIRNDESAEAVTQLSKELDSKEQYIETVRCLFNEQLEKLKKICANVIGGIDGSENTDLDSLNRRLSDAKFILLSPSSMVHLEYLANERCGYQLRDLINCVPALTDKDKSILIFNILGFTPKSISLLNDEKVSNYYNRLSRLKKKIAATGNEKAIELLNRLI